MAALAMFSWLMVFLVVVVFAVLTESILLLYLGFGTAWGISILIVVLHVYLAKLVPERIGHDAENIYYLEKRGHTKKIPFSEIERIDCSRSEKGYIGIRKIDGTDVCLGPGCGGKYGKQLLELYSEWVSQKLGKEAKIKEAKILYHKIYKVDV